MGKRRLLAFVALIGFGLVSSSPGAPSAAGPFPDYVDAKANWVLLSNAQWHAGSVKARELRVQSVLLSSLSEKSSLLWAPTCSHDAQRIDLTRQVNLPGRPAQVEFNLDPQTSVGPNLAPILESVELRVNGHTAVEIPAAAMLRPNLLQFQLPAAKLGLFRFGENSLVVEVTKAATPTSTPTCNRSPSTLVGVAFGLRGTSAADLSVRVPVPTQYVRGSAYQFSGVFTVHNAGPSAAIGGSFKFITQLDFLDGAIDNTLHPVTASAPFGPCTAGGPLSGPLTVSCPFTVFPPGATATISITTVVRLRADQSPAGVYSMDVSWSAASFAGSGTAISQGTYDPNTGNESQSEAIYLCGPKATDPKCPGAPAG